MSGITQSNHKIFDSKLMERYYIEIINLTDDYCIKNLNEEVLHLTQNTAALLCQKKFSLVTTEAPTIWACGVISAVGFVNFLYDKNSDPHINTKDLARSFGVSQSTAGTKSKQIRNVLKMELFNHHWCLPSKIAQFPRIWMIPFKRFTIDARTLPRRNQEIAFKKGLIPYVHAEKVNKKRVHSKNIAIDLSLMKN